MTRTLAAGALIGLTLMMQPAWAAPPAADWAGVAPVTGARAFAHYQALHRIPELGKLEVKTAAYIRQTLTAAGFRTFVPVPGLPTAVIATLDSGRPGHVVALRAEMDARPGHETSGLAYASRVPDLVHSCGHDAHTAMLLAVAETLAGTRQTLTGKLVFIFQPAEETPGGADDIVDSGVLTRLGVESLFALHAAPGLPVGAVEMAPGAILAGSHYVTVTVTGRESHAATPQEGDDVPAATAELITDLVHFPSRKLDVLGQPLVISVTSMAAGDATSGNRLPGTAVFRGTVRTFHDITATVPGQKSTRELIDDFVSARAHSLGVKATVVWRPGPPPTTNDRGIYETSLAGLRSRWPGLTIGQARPYMFAEDFAHYTRTIRSLYVSWGVAKDRLGWVSVHKDAFTIHPDAFPVGARLLLEFAAIHTPRP